MKEGQPKKKQPDMGVPDRFLGGVRRHGLSTEEFSTFSKLQGNSAKFDFLLKSAQASGGAVDQSVIQGYQKALGAKTASVPSSTHSSPRPSQGAFGKGKGQTSSTPPLRSSPRGMMPVDYTDRGQRDAHEQRALLVQGGDDTKSPGKYGRPSTPRPSSTFNFDLLSIGDE